jgi:hypothetical protein
VWFEELALHAPIDTFWHNPTGQESDGARRAPLVAVINGRLDFGTWERILDGEFSGRPRKRMLIKIIGK